MKDDRKKEGLWYEIMYGPNGAEAAGKLLLGVGFIAFFFWELLSAFM